MAKDIVFDFMDASKTGTDILPVVQKTRFRPTLRQYRILEAANKELKEQLATTETLRAATLKAGNIIRDMAVYFQKNGDRATRLNWYLLALIVALNICLMLR